METKNLSKQEVLCGLSLSKLSEEFPGQASQQGQSTKKRTHTYTHIVAFIIYLIYIYD